jgi:ABC-type antimicrobial peptide transport system permease subunit
MADRIDDTFATPRLYTFLLSIFAGLALLLAAVGLYGVLAFQVGRRRREFGIRIALGAVHGQIMTLVLRRGVTLLLVGTATGTLGALALGRLLGSLLYHTSAFDAVVLGSVIAALGIVALLACWLPARRTLRIDPTVALRSE